MSHTEYTEQLQGVNYAYLPDDAIHTIELTDASRQTIDQFLQFMNELYRDLTDEDTVRLLVDYRQSGVPPLSYVINKSTQWANNLSVHPQARVAFVNKSDFLMSILGMMMKSLRFGHLKTRVFDKETAYQDAIEWLKKA